MEEDSTARIFRDMAEQDEAIQFPREPQQPPEALDQAQQEPEPLQLDQPPLREPQPQIPAEEPTDLEVTFVVQNFIWYRIRTVLCTPLLFHHDCWR